MFAIIGVATVIALIGKDKEVLTRARHSLIKETKEPEIIKEQIIPKRKGVIRRFLGFLKANLVRFWRWLY